MTHAQLPEPAEVMDPGFYSILGPLAAQVDDLEKLRIASTHRYRLLAHAEEDSDGIVRGAGLGIEHPEVKRLSVAIAGMKELEEQVIKNLQRFMRHSAWGPWLRQAKGVGEKQLARLLAATGDPYWHVVHERPRTVTELWAYCGYHTVPVGGEGKTIVVPEGELPPLDAYFAAPRRQKGVQANWSEDGRKRAYLIATSCLKQPEGTRYRDIYNATRAKHADAVHTVTCVRCGPSGKPALAGDPLSPGHQHGRALRKVAKEVLKDLWVEARRLRGDEPEGGDRPPVYAITAKNSEHAAEKLARVG